MQLYQFRSNNTGDHKSSMRENFDKLSNCRYRLTADFDFDELLGTPYNSLHSWLVTYLNL